MAGYGWLKRWRAISRDKVIRLLMWIGLTGILLIAVSEIDFSRNKTEASDTIILTETQVEQALEKRIAALLRQVEGVGTCRVMVTLECGTRAMYAADTVSATGTDGSGSYSESYLTVDTDSGPVGLLLTRIQPTVKGVAVVCDGGGDAAVQQRVIQVVSTAFHISDRRVCVVKQE